MLWGNAISHHDNSLCGHTAEGKWYCRTTFLNQFHDAFIKQFCLVFDNVLQREVGVSLAK